MTATFYKFIFGKGIVFKWTRVISANLCSSNLSRLYWRMRTPFFVNSSLAQLCSQVVAPRPRRFIGLVLTCINKISLLANVLYLFFFLRPFHTYVISIWRWIIQLLLNLSDVIKIGCLISSLWLEQRLFGPNILLISFILIFSVILAGPGEQFNLIS